MMTRTRLRFEHPHPHHRPTADRSHLREIVLCALLIARSGFGADAAADETSGIEVVQHSEVAWTHLNPKRGDLAPKAGTLWGDRNGSGATGFLLKPSDGFASPPHIHNVSYRGIVIRGLIHNDDPEAAALWMPAGSFWTQPRGEVHITAAEGADTLAYIEIEAGPYLVQPSEEAFDSGERPINLHRTNVVWQDAADLEWIRVTGADAPQAAMLWGHRAAGELNGTLLKLPAGARLSIESPGRSFRAVVIGGAVHYAQGETIQILDPGSYFGSRDGATHSIQTSPDGESLVYVRTDGPFEIAPGE